jgi:hypothetical protein
MDGLDTLHTGRFEALLLQGPFDKVKKAVAEEPTQFELCPVHRYRTNILIGCRLTTRDCGWSQIQGCVDLLCFLE